MNLFKRLGIALLIGIITQYSTPNLSRQAYYDLITNHVHGSSPYSENFKKRSYNDRVLPDAVIYIDMQRAYLGGTEAGRFADMMPFVIGTLEYAMERDIPIFLVESYVSSVEGSDKPDKTIDAITDFTGSYNKVYHVLKTENDAVVSSDLVKVLEREGIHSGDFIYVGGIAAGECVYLTVNSLNNQGYNIVTSFDTIINDIFTEIDIPEQTLWSWYQENTITGAFYFEVLAGSKEPTWFVNKLDFDIISSGYSY